MLDLHKCARRIKLLHVSIYNEFLYVIKFFVSVHICPDSVRCKMYILYEITYIFSLKLLGVFQNSYSRSCMLIFFKCRCDILMVLFVPNCVIKHLRANFFCQVNHNVLYLFRSEQLFIFSIVFIWKLSIERITFWSIHISSYYFYNPCSECALHRKYASIRTTFYRFRLEFFSAARDTTAKHLINKISSFALYSHEWFIVLYVVAFTPYLSTSRNVCADYILFTTRSAATFAKIIQII